MWENADRATVQAAVRAAALVVVVAWLFSDDVRAWVPIWVPIVLLLVAELEFVFRGRREPPRPATSRMPRASWPPARLGRRCRDRGGRRLPCSPERPQRDVDRPRGGRPHDGGDPLYGRGVAHRGESRADPLRR